MIQKDNIYKMIWYIKNNIILVDEGYFFMKNKESINIYIDKNYEI